MWQLSSGAFLGWALGSNDAANVFGTGVSTGLVRFRTATILIAVFVILGAVLEGPKCMLTLNELSSLGSGMAFCATLAAALVICAASIYGLPASSSQAIVGAIFFIGLTNGTADSRVLAKIFLAWAATPLCAALLSLLLYRVLALLLQPLLTRLHWRTFALRTGILLAGCYGSYSLGSNNVANVTAVYVSSGSLTALQASVIGGVAIAVGVLTYSKKVMLTVGQGIFALDSFSAFITVLTLALSSHLFTQIGVPVSSTQAVVGAVIGIGLLKDLHSLNLRTLGTIVFAWIVTPLASGLICVILYSTYRLLLPV